MPALNQRGVIHYIVLLILLLGLVGGVLLVTRGEPLKFLPKAGGGISGPISPTTSFTLFPSKQSYNLGEEVQVQVLVHSDVTAANLFDAKINYDPQVLQLGRVDVTSPFIKNWVEQYWGDPGKVSLVGGVPNPGFQSQVGDIAPMATLYFIALKTGQTTVSFEDTSAIYSNADNVNILGPKNGVTIAIGTAGSPVPTPTPSLTPSPGNPSITEGAFRLQLTPTQGNTKCQRGDVNCFYQAVVIATNRTDRPLYNTTLYTVNPQGVLQYTGFDGLWTTGRSTTNRVIQPGQEAINTLVKLVPARTDGTWTGALYIDGQTCNIQSTPPTDCYYYGASSLTITINFTDVPSSPTPTATPIPGTGDGNNDGKINLIDLSVLLTDFNKESGFRPAIDMNGDGKINTFDFSLMRNLLIEKKVIRG